MQENPKPLADEAEEPAEIFAPPRFEGIEAAAARVNEAVANLNEAMLDLAAKHGVDVSIAIGNLRPADAAYPDVFVKVISVEMIAKL